MNLKKTVIIKLRKNPVCIKAAIVVLVSFLMFLCVYIRDNSRKLENDAEGRNVIRRTGHAGEENSRKLKIKAGTIEESVNVTVSGKAYDEKEIKEKFEEAYAYLEKVILSDNESFDNIRSDMNLITEIPDMGISVVWEISNYDIMDIRGGLRSENLTEEGTLVKLKAVLCYENEKTSYEFYVRIFPPRMNRSEKLLKEINTYLEKMDEETKTQDYLPLPESINGIKIQWEYPRNARAFAFLILGAGGACMICVSDRQKRKKKEKEKIVQMKTDYPKIINKFNLYLGAGMTVKKAWFRIASDYEKERERKGKRQAYEEMIYTMHQIQGGAAEGESYENFGTRCRIAAYRKFGSMLSQNLRKGSKGLCSMLRREAEEAFEERKNLARKLGEEAGTKLMIPMFMMLGIVFVIVIVPAFFTISI